jgi:agmatinase
MHRIFELCPISQVGVRSLSWEEKQFLTQNKLKPFYMSNLTANAGSIDQIMNSLSEDVYVTIDVDVLDPAIMPAVGTPEPDGMSWQQVLDIIESVVLHKHVVGFDLMEFCPGEGPASCAYLLAKLAYKLIGYTVPPEEQ